MELASMVLIWLGLATLYALALCRAAAALGRNPTPADGHHPASQTL